MGEMVLDIVNYKLSIEMFQISPTGRENGKVLVRSHELLLYRLCDTKIGTMSLEIKNLKGRGIETKKTWFCECLDTRWEDNVYGK